MIDTLQEIQADIRERNQDAGEYNQNKGFIGNFDASEHEEKRNQEQHVEMSSPQEVAAAPGFAIGVETDRDPAKITDYYGKKYPFGVAGLPQLAPAAGKVDHRAENQQHIPGLGGIGIARQHDDEQREQGCHQGSGNLFSGKV
jgi:hypothetical protein